MRELVNTLATALSVAGYILLLGPAGYTTPAHAQQPSAAPSAVTVLDGDTVERGGLRYRLAGLDAPEIHHAKCAREREAGIRSAARLVALLAERPHELADLGKGGGFGRRLGRLTIAGEDWATIAVREGHGIACAGRCERKSHDWCAAKP